MTITITFTGIRQTIKQGQTWIKKRPFLTLAGLILVLALLVGWRWTRPGARFGPLDGTWYRVQVNRDLYVGLDPNYPPFAEWTPDGITGIEADIAREIGRRLGVETHILIMGFDGLYDSLYTGYVDFLISGLQVDSEYKDWVHYTRPYFDAGQVLVSRADSPIEHIRQLDGGTVAVEIASAGDLGARQWQRRLHSLDIERYMLPDDAMRAVQNGEVNAALVDTVSVRFYLNEHDGLVMASKTTVPEGYRIVLREGNFRLVEEVERALDDMIADGTLEEIINQWLPTSKTQRMSRR
ncbi:MAG: amino acid ABC transporter substrate-binding protein [Anaerolineae bacterium]|nr:amino acid ABC transporter substrate-binding protein [Anaerolineae bacterium]